MSQPSRTATQWLSARQVADELGLKPETVARHLAAGKIPGGTPAFGNWRKAASISYTETLRASWMRGAWLVGPMKRPENR